MAAQGITNSREKMQRRQNGGEVVTLGQETAAWRHCNVSDTTCDNNRCVYSRMGGAVLFEQYLSLQNKYGSGSSDRAS